MKPVLLLVDLQNDFLRIGELEPHPGVVVAAAAQLLEQCRSARIPIVHVWSTVDKSRDNRMPHRKKGDEWLCLEGSAGHDCPDSLKPRKTEPVLHKTFFSGFSTDQLQNIIRELKADCVILAGVHLHACIRATALDAYAKQLRVIVAEDATGSNDPLHAAATKRYLEERSIVFRNAAEIGASLSGDFSHLEMLYDKDSPIVFTHRSPGNLSRQWQITAATKDAVESKVLRARTVFRNWRGVAADERLRHLQTWGAALRDYEAEFVNLLIEDVGKPIKYARAEVARAVALIEAAAAQIDREQDETPAKTGYRRQPHGVVGLIGPFNNPLAIPLGKIVPALLYGNVVVWKPAVPGSRIAEKAAEIFTQATGQFDVLQIVCGGDAVARQVMAIADAVTLSGSLKAGRSAQEICGSRHIPLQAELGGNNASIVWRDADLEAAATAIAEGAFVFAGQRCTANRRVILDSDIYDAFVDRLIVATARLVWGNPADEQTQIGPLVSQAARDRVTAIVERARPSCRIITPTAKPDTLARGTWVGPTIVCCDKPEAEIVQEETFGPILVVQRAATWEDAISLCNGVKQGLAAAAFSSSPSLIADFFSRAEAGILKINCSTADAAVDLPFGGWKASGVGPPEHGPANREFFTRMQATYFS